MQHARTVSRDLRKNRCAAIMSTYVAGSKSHVVLWEKFQGILSGRFLSGLLPEELFLNRQPEYGEPPSSPEEMGPIHSLSGA